MDLASIFISAPWDARWCPSSCFPWERYEAFQPLLGFDAQIADIVDYLKGAGEVPYVVAAPEIFADLESLRRASPKGGVGSDNLQPVHLRFGSLRDPGLVKGTKNIAFLAEQPEAPFQTRRHPFASGVVAPHGLTKVASYFPVSSVLRRPNGEAVATTVLPRYFSAGVSGSLARSQIIRHARYPGPRASLLMQTAQDFSPQDWARKVGRHLSFSSEGGIASLDEPFIMLPWNLSFPGSAVPNILMKVEALSSQGKFPMKLVVFPFNDTPLGARAINDLTKSMAAQSATNRNEHRVFFTRAFSAQTGSYLAARCRRVWIDATDPEWLWTTRRLQSLGVSVNFIADRGDRLTGVFPSTRFSADEPFDLQGWGIYNGLHWRGLRLSVRMLSALAAAVYRGQDAPYTVQAGANEEKPHVSALQDFFTGAEKNDLLIAGNEARS